MGVFPASCANLTHELGSCESAELVDDRRMFPSRGPLRWERMNAAFGNHTDSILYLTQFGSKLLFEDLTESCLIGTNLGDRHLGISGVDIFFD